VGNAENTVDELVLVHSLFRDLSQEAGRSAAALRTYVVDDLDAGIDLPSSRLLNNDLRPVTPDKSQYTELTTSATIVCALSICEHHASLALYTGSNKKELS
jgi:hypothetical protein